MMKTILIMSGGLDSTVLLYHLLLDRGHQVKALSIYYGQRHWREIRSAEAICKKLHVEQRVATLTGTSSLLKGSSQTDISIPVPHGRYDEESMKTTVVPNCNMILLAIAGAWAVSMEFDSIAYAVHTGDHTIYPDCRETFIAPMQEAFKHANWHPIEIYRPFLTLAKADIVRLGYDLDVPLELTYSCYEGDRIHCGECGACVERKEAFVLAGIPDPTQYKK